MGANMHTSSHRSFGPSHGVGTATLSLSLSSHTHQAQVPTEREQDPGQLPQQTATGRGGSSSTPWCGVVLLCAAANSKQRSSSNWQRVWGVGSCMGRGGGVRAAELQKWHTLRNKTCYPTPNILTWTATATWLCVASRKLEGDTHCRTSYSETMILNDLCSSSQ